MKKTAQMIITIILYLILMILIMSLVWRNGIYPSGSDVMYHVYRGDYVYHSVLKGNWWPLYNPMWYNGVELMRYWPPVTAYILALCEWLMSGKIFLGYILFVGMIFLFGALSWAVIGFTHKRVGIGVFLGVLWFFMPNNLFALFVEGNLPRSLIMTVLPLTVCFLYDYLQDARTGSMAGFVLTFSFIVLCHVGYAGMIAISVLILLLFYRIFCGGHARQLDVIWGMVISFALTGIYLYPSVKGGIVSGDSGYGTSSVMKKFFQSALISLDPVSRIKNGDASIFYFGLAAFLLAVFGMIASRRKSLPGFWTAFVIFLGTTASAYSLLKALPGGQYLWMLRFISIALCFILFSFFLWNSLRKPLILLMCILLVADTVPSLEQIYGNGLASTPQERYDTLQEKTLIGEAKKMTVQRLALMDDSTMYSTGAFLVSDYSNGVPAVFGAGWEASVTAAQIVQINQSMEDGDYLYMFDRLLMLGADTVLMKKNVMHEKGYDTSAADSAASANGYTREDSNDEYVLYHNRNVTGTYGVISSYSGIAIGTNASDVARMFPSVQEAGDEYLDDFTYEQLSAYRIVYLNHFKYHDLEKAQNLVTKLSENGIRVVIFADGIPIDRSSQTQRFLGVECQQIQFHNGYPEFDTQLLGNVSCDLFPMDYRSWDTVYVNGLDKVLGSASDLDKKLSFYGTVKNDNILVIGFNLVYFYSLTHDPTVEKLLSGIVDTSTDELPSHTLVPLRTIYRADRIVIETDSSASAISSDTQINTTMAFHDIFSSDRVLAQHNHLLYVQKGRTEVLLTYPYFKQGLMLSIAGIVMLIIFLMIIHKSGRKKSD
ncbi:MAG: 6-pyruvoyl-tetrahydropterin synthase-related protein [Butyrivibrio sp.]|jgi:uncharacterized membrane protein|nr:6-pyruvoyl-tetrahydropterin synthase-related protein [Butyrivibrio sp.]